MQNFPSNMPSDTPSSRSAHQHMTHHRTRRRQQAICRCPRCGYGFTTSLSDNSSYDQASPSNSDGHPVRFDALDPGDRVIFGDRSEPLTVDTIDEDLTVAEGTITIVARATLTGPRGGTVWLEQTATDRVRAKVGSLQNPAYTVQSLVQPTATA